MPFRKIRTTRKPETACVVAPHTLQNGGGRLKTSPLMQRMCGRAGISPHKQKAV
ncbi:hypothetical protein HMPREF9123_2902 [Neisseria bacilliformis ATCC BAA-1200]|uniref:Uncharacterized protein n=1 Tax=Neisseria bacilliformis ATCC BAA-1200 TaxID=888742 RepID=F2BGP5_9NEIS|nr:hypothetical protein HMPREF9123_2902 [Neisseria bacilliformis ATCC BAA-1200]